MDLRSTLVYMKQCYGRSMGYFGYITQFLIITANIKLFETPINSLGITTLQAVVVAFPIFIFGNLLLGHLDLRYGIWRAENDFSWRVTPMANDLCERAKRIEKILNEGDTNVK